VVADLASALGRDFPRRLVPAHFDRERYAHDAGMQWEEPAAVATPGSEADVVRLVRWCARHDLPLTPRGAGSSIAGNAFGHGLVLDFSRRMRRIVHVGARRVTVEPGVVLGALNRRLRAQRHRIGPSPSSEAFCTIGGMVGNNAAGSHSLWYGATAENLLAARFVTADGKLHAWSGPRSHPRAGLEARLARIAAGYRCPWPEVAKSSSGYLLDKLATPEGWNPQRVLCGAEGTLGILTQAELRTHPLPEAEATLLLAFTSSDAALRSVPRVLAHDPAALEMVDEAALDVVARRHPHLPRAARDAGCCLVVDLFGARPALRPRASALAAAARGWAGVQAVEVAERPRERARLWAARKDVEPLLRAKPGRRRPLPFIEDVAVPVAAQTRYVASLHRILRAEGLEAPLYGHAGQGNLHIRPFLDPRRAADRARMERVNRRVALLARRLGGTLTGEHGDGYLRSGVLRALYPEAADAFRRVKQLLDPDDLMNPGKIVETARARVAPQLFLDGPRYAPPPWT